jgi:hypothetical protein
MTKTNQDIVRSDSVESSWKLYGIHSPEFRAKMRAAHKGRPGGMYGKTHSPETRAKMSAAHKGKTPWNKGMKGQVPWMKGKTHSPETRAKISAAKQGEKHHMYGKTHSPETRAKMSAALKERTRLLAKQQTAAK